MRDRPAAAQPKLYLKRQPPTAPSAGHFGSTPGLRRFLNSLPRWQESGGLGDGRRWFVAPRESPRRGKPWKSRERSSWSFAQQQDQRGGVGFRSEEHTSEL